MRLVTVLFGALLTFLTGAHTAADPVLEQAVESLTGIIERSHTAEELATGSSQAFELKQACVMESDEAACSRLIGLEPGKDKVTPWAVAVAYRQRGEMRQLRGDLVGARDDFAKALNLHAFPDLAERMVSDQTGSTAETLITGWDTQIVGQEVETDTEAALPAAVSLVPLKDSLLVREELTALRTTISPEAPPEPAAIAGVPTDAPQAPSIDKGSALPTASARRTQPESGGRSLDAAVGASVLDAGGDHQTCRRPSEPPALSIAAVSLAQTGTVDLNWSAGDEFSSCTLLGPDGLRIEGRQGGLKVQVVDLVQTYHLECHACGNVVIARSYALVPLTITAASQVANGPIDRGSPAHYWAWFAALAALIAGGTTLAWNKLPGVPARQDGARDWARDGARDWARDWAGRPRMSAEKTQRGLPNLLRASAAISGTSISAVARPAPSEVTATLAPDSSLGGAILSPATAQPPITGSAQPPVDIVAVSPSRQDTNRPNRKAVAVIASQVACSQDAREQLTRSDLSDRREAGRAVNAVVDFVRAKLNAGPNAEQILWAIRDCSHEIAVHDLRLLREHLGHAAPAASGRQTSPDILNQDWIERLGQAWLTIVGALPERVLGLSTTAGNAPGIKVALHALLDCPPVVTERIVQNLFERAGKDRLPFPSLRSVIESNIGQSGEAGTGAQATGSSSIISVFAGTPLERLLSLDILYPLSGDSELPHCHAICGATSARDALLAAWMNEGGNQDQNRQPLTLVLDLDGSCARVRNHGRSTRPALPELSSESADTQLPANATAPETRFTTAGLLCDFGPLWTENSLGRERTLADACDCYGFFFDAIFGQDLVREHAATLRQFLKAMQAKRIRGLRTLRTLLTPADSGVLLADVGRIAGPATQRFFETRYLSAELAEPLRRMESILATFIGDATVRHLITSERGADSTLRHRLREGGLVVIDLSGASENVRPALARLVLSEMMVALGAGAPEDVRGHGRRVTVISNGDPSYLRDSQTDLEQILNKLAGCNGRFMLLHNSLSEISIGIWRAFQKYGAVRIAGSVGDQDAKALAALLDVAADRLVTPTGSTNSTPSLLVNTPEIAGTHPIVLH